MQEKTTKKLQIRVFLIIFQSFQYFKERFYIVIGYWVTLWLQFKSLRGATIFDILKKTESKIRHSVCRV